MSYTIENSSNNLVKQLLIIENLYSEINIKKALIICQNSYLEINNLVSILENYDHSVSTIKSINNFINNIDSKLLTISINDFEIYKEILFSDIDIDTIFAINCKLTNEIYNLFSGKIIVFDLTL